MKTVLFSTLFPSQSRPGHGLFVEARLRRLLRSGAIESKVIAPVPWFPSSNRCFGEYARFAATPKFESRGELDVYHPRYFLPPKVSMSLAPLLLAQGARRKLAALTASGFDFDLIDAHYYYPDGVAAALLGRWFNKPVVITARGSDINVLSEYAVPRYWIRWAQARVAASVFVSDTLKQKMALLANTNVGLHVIKNGVDQNEFPLLDRKKSQADLGLDAGRWMIFVGRLTRPKGVHLVVQTLAKLPNDVKLAVVGDGSEREALGAIAAQMGVAARVRFAGARPQHELPTWYSAASVLVLPSENEGIPNVILEAFACGTPVVASAVGGIPEVMTATVAGKIVENPCEETLAVAVLEVLDANFDPHAVRDHASNFTWQDTTDSQLALFRDVLRTHREDSACAT